MKKRSKGKKRGGKKYKIVRHFQSSPGRTIKRGLTLTQAKKHCKDSRTHDMRGPNPWFDGFTEEK
jgi:hypothetical protein